MTKSKKRNIIDKIDIDQKGNKMIMTVIIRNYKPDNMPDKGYYQHITEKDINSIINDNIITSMVWITPKKGYLFIEFNRKENICLKNVYYQ